MTETKNNPTEKNMTKLSKTAKKIMAALADATAPMSSAELAEIAGVTKATARNNAEKLVRAYDRKTREYVEGPLAHGPSRGGSYTYCLKEKAEQFKAEAEAADEARARREAKEAGMVECQVCERFQCADKRGALVNHGYRRPGWGFIVGGCDGVGHQPFPQTNALESYLERVKSAQADNAERLSNRASWATLTIRVYVGYGKGPERDGYEPRTIERITDEQRARLEQVWAERDDDGWDDDGRRAEWLKLSKTVQTWDDAHSSEIRRCERFAKELVAEEQRVVARIAKGKQLQAEGVGATKAERLAAERKAKADELDAALAELPEDEDEGPGGVAEARCRERQEKIDAAEAELAELVAAVEAKRAELAELKGGE